MLTKYTYQAFQVIPRDRQPLLSTAGKRKVIPLNTDEFRYLRFRAIGCMEDPLAGPNGNWDGFPYEHFEDDRPNHGYKSFIGKRAHVEHNSSEGVGGSIGDLPDAFLNKFIFPKELGNIKWADLTTPSHDNQRLAILGLPKQTAGDIEVLMRIDTKLVRDASLNQKARRTAERILRMIDTGQKLGCSMGTNIEYSVCSACGNVAHFAHEYCPHIKNRKGAVTVVSANDVRDLLAKGSLRPEWLQHLMISKLERDDVLKGYANRNVAIRNAEINHVLSFFELSIVGNPAFTRALQLDKYAKIQNQNRLNALEGKSQTQIVWENLSDEDMLRFTTEAQKRGLIATSCAVR